MVHRVVTNLCMVQSSVHTDAVVIHSSIIREWITSKQDLSA
ncbi:hypothetical protein APHCRT_0907 [Anaplasma phagocytophilum str. CRT53-1]|uniref:Uncharacterized protein n=1 Tax=Anaplasma phagocytophilum str. CRT53-1 TaxID=1359157 RepID=A0A0F3PZR7_ANAPH|nr:hypothetical protein APHCRT_0916 [Anaplasma phagocytophilum str. CRT53-1]KJV85813.1 hypothetical protein APHCRT_0907 [Anaplasma phagocytophilum str. CRT53-1]